jgi:hypothetical protein
MQVTWFAAKLVLECVAEGSDDSLCDEQTRVIEAESAEAAYDAAMAIGKAEQNEFVNAEGGTSAWVFRGLSDLVDLSLTSIESGAEVWSTLYEGTDPSQLVAPKERLTAISMQCRLNMRASELLPRRMRRYAPS